MVLDKPAAIAIDGPVASGKTAVGTLVAKRLGFRFLDTGSMYRAVTLVALERRIDLEDKGALVKVVRNTEIQVAPPAADGGQAGGNGDRLLVDGRDVTDRLRDLEVEGGVSLVAKVSGVRSALVEQQRTIAHQGPIVMVGRDIGTVVLPDAPVKVYLTASVEVRARRRTLELQGQGHRADYGQVLDEIIRRDKIDSERADSPLRPAADAVLVETDDLGVEELAQRVVELAERQR